MALNFYSPNKLKTWNNILDWEIWFLLSVVQWDISSFLNEKWNIECSKIDEQLNDILLWMDNETQILVQKTVISVRKKILINLIIWKKIKLCKNLKECEDIISKYWKWVILDIFSLSTILNKCSSYSECESAISKYWKWITLNVVSLSTILKIILKDKSLDKNAAKDLIKTILVWINNIWNLDKNNEDSLIALMSYSYWEYNSFIWEVINWLQLSKLYFLNEYLKPKEKNKKIKKPRKIIPNTQQITKKTEPTKYEIRLQGAQKAWLGGLSQLFAAWKLDTNMWSTWRSNKSWSRFWWKIKEM